MILYLRRVMAWPFTVGSCRSPTVLHILTIDIYADVNTAALKSAGRADFQCSQINCTVPCCTGACFSLLWDDGKSLALRSSHGCVKLPQSLKTIFQVRLKRKNDHKPASSLSCAQPDCEDLQYRCLSNANQIMGKRPRDLRHVLDEIYQRPKCSPVVVSVLGIRDKC